MSLSTSVWLASIGKERDEEHKRRVDTQKFEEKSQT